MSKEMVPYAALIVAVVLIYIPRMVVARYQAKQPEGYDNAHPRAQQAKLTGVALRAQGAHNNSFEAFAPFAAGVLACKVAGVDADEIVLGCMAFIGFRIAYLVCYLANKPTLRSTVWMLAFAASLGLLCLPFAA